MGMIAGVVLTFAVFVLHVLAGAESVCAGG